MSWPDANDDPVGSLTPVRLYLLSVVLKLLLVYTYASTDLDVHTNWMAITHTHHFKDWYGDHASPSVWTLDYPPLFAWFEYGLAKVAWLFPALRPFLNVGSAGAGADTGDIGTDPSYATCGLHTACLLYQRLSVISSEFLLFASVYFATIRSSRRVRNLATFLVLFHPGLLIVDHMHFQYNGFLLGLLLISMTLATYGNDVLATVAFSLTLCFKHLFLYVAPAFGCYYLGVLYVVGGWRRVRLFASLSVAAGCVLAVAFGPVVYYGTGEQVVARLFPLQRGLIHAYWAPNAWALYAAVDKVLGIVWSLGGDVDGARSQAALTGGLVQVARFRVLPQVESGTTAVVTLVAMMPALVGLLRRPLAGTLWPAVVYCSLCSFMFGYHVHEKAILMTLVPMAVAVAKGEGVGGTSAGTGTGRGTGTGTNGDVKNDGDGDDGDDADDERGRVLQRRRGRYLFLSLVGTFSLFPLLTGVEEYLPKVGMFVGYAVVAGVVLRGSFSSGGMTRAERLFCTVGVAAVEVYATFLHRKVFGEAWPFVPLMLVSCYCALGIAWVWLALALEFIAPRAS